jgi:hypothetical protein
LKLRDGPAGRWRECEWPAGEDEPKIRWREDDDADTRQRVLSWFLRRWETVDAFVIYCVSQAVKIYAYSAKVLPALPKGLTHLLADSAKVLPALPKGLTHLSAYSATNKSERLDEQQRLA